MKNGNFLWSTAKPTKGGAVATSVAPALCDVNFKIKPGEVVAVVGPVGSGKSALVKGLLGELAPVPKSVIDQSLSSPSNDGLESSDALGILEQPSVVSHGNIGYCSQEAWLAKGTIREAVVFGREYDEQRYLDALRDAGLDRDIVDTIDGTNSTTAASQGVLSHDTDVGEGGSSLSGGQRARVALARALYAGEDTKVFLLDDPLAALDASVGSTVFERLTRRLRGEKAATVLVTNDPSIPRRCDRVILMGKYSPSSSSCSTIVDMGTYSQLLARGHDIQAISAHKDDSEADDAILAEEYVLDDTPSVEGSGKRESRRKNTVRVVGGYEVPLNDTDSYYQCDPESHACRETLPDYIADQVVPVTREDLDMDSATAAETAGKPSSESDSAVALPEETKTGPPVVKKLTSLDDTMSRGAVPFSTYISYLKYVKKPILIAAMVLSYLLANGAQFFQQYVVAKWTEVGNADAMAVALGGRYLRSLVYAAGVVSVFLWLRSFLTMQVGVRASRFLHQECLNLSFLRLCHSSTQHHQGSYSQGSEKKWKWWTVPFLIVLDL